MSHFRTPLEVQLITDDQWELKSPLSYVSDLVGEITVPAGFVTDFASVPRIPFAYWLTGDIAHKASVVHDYLCVTDAHPQAVIDKVFLEASEASGVSAWHRYLMYFGVRLFDLVGRGGKK